MTLNLSPGWTIDVDRGPDWLFIRLHANSPFTGEEVSLAEPLWQVMQQHFTNRLVMEMDDIHLLHSRLIGELVQLQGQVESQGGLMRLCGLSDNNQQVLKSMHIAERFPHFGTREAAVMGDRPTKPR